MKLSTYLLTAIAALACTFAVQTKAARILGFFPSPSKSHIIIHCAIADTLAEAGHEVTVISTVPNMYKKAKYNFIHVEGTMYDSKFANEMVNKPAFAYVRFYQAIFSITAMANSTFNHPTIQEFLQTHQAGDFDVIILGYMMNDFVLGIGAHFQCPIIVSFTIQPVFFINSMIANPLEPSYVPSLLNGLKQPMGFWSRVQNMFSIAVEDGFFMSALKRKGELLYR